MGNLFSLLSISLLARAVGISGCKELSAELGGCGCTSTVLGGPRGPPCAGDSRGCHMPLFQVRRMRFLRERSYHFLDCMLFTVWWAAPRHYHVMGVACQLVDILV